MGRKRLRLFGRLGPPANGQVGAKYHRVRKSSPGSRNIPGNIPARPPDLEAIRLRQEALEVQLDNQELARRRAAIDADLAAVLASSPCPPPPARPCPASPILAVPVALVVTATDLAVLVRAWDLEVWIPKSAIHDASENLLAGWSGQLEVSSRWAHRAGLHPPQPAPERARRSAR